jgi:Cu(I)/Ag(I) efflux system membrane fusion protein
VNLGQVTHAFAQILGGVEEGEQVVVSAQFLLDSESSIHSDFMRMSLISAQDSHKNKVDVVQVNTVDEEVDSANVEGVINQIDHQTRVANISRGPIEKWGRGPATLDFIFAQSLSINKLQPGDSIYLTFDIQNGDFLITDYAFTMQENRQEHDHD